MSGSTRLDQLLGIGSAEEPRQARTARFVAIVSASGLAAALAGGGLTLLEPDPDLVTFLALGGIATVCGVCFSLNRRGLSRIAGRLLFVTAALGTTLMTVTGRTVGFGDIVFMLYPVTVIAAGLLLGRRESAFGLGLILVLLAVPLAATLGGAIPTSQPAAEATADFGFAVLITLVSGLASRLMAAKVERSAADSQANQAALARANEQLREQATRRETLIRELKRRNEELQHFAYAVSHDLKSPLVTIGAFTGCIERSARSGDRRQLLDDLGWIKQAQERMSDLLKDLLRLSRAGRLGSAVERIDFGEIVEEARALTEGVFAERNARLEVSADLPSVTGDRRSLVQLLQNLFDNAAKFSGDSPSPLVEVGAREIDGETVFYVRDRGIGIAPADHGRIFELFRKLQPATPGTGVGLALVQRIVAAHGGRVWVESEGDGTGAEFRFTLGGAAPPPGVGGKRTR